MSSLNNLFSAKGLIGGSWQTRICMLAAVPGMNHNYPRVAIDTNGNATAVWFRYAKSGSIYSSVVTLSSTLLANGSSCSAIPTIISDAISQRNPADLSVKVAADSNGNVMSIYTTSADGASFMINTAVKPYGSNWIIAGGLIGSIYSYAGDLSVSSLGDSLISLPDWNGSDLSIVNIETDISNPTHNVFSQFQTISLGSDNAYPHISLALTGLVLNGITLWTNNDGINNRINASTGTRSIVLPPSNLSVNQNVNNFGVFTEYYNTID